MRIIIMTHTHTYTYTHTHTHTHVNIKFCLQLPFGDIFKSLKPDRYISYSRGKSKTFYSEKYFDSLINYISCTINNLQNSLYKFFL